MNMKRFLLIAAGICVIAIGVVIAESTKIKETGAGMQIGTTATQKIGFFGAAPVVKQTGVTNAGAALATLTVSSATITYQAVDGSTSSVSVVTNVAINAVAGFASTNQANAINNSLRNLGLAGN
jgi:hypothetical protein